MKDDFCSGQKILKFSNDVKFFDLDGIPIIGNFRNQAVIGLDEAGIDFVNKINAGVLNFDDLKDPQGLEAFEENEKELLRALRDNGYFDADLPMSLKSAYVHVTDRCNLHCVGCYSFKDCRNKNKDLSTEKIKYIFETLVKNGVDLIVVSGGEPFLRDDLPEILRYAKKDLKLKELHIISNGTMPFERYDRCIEYLDNISISIDGYDEKTSFIRDPGIMPKVLETVRYLKNKANVSLIATLHKKNSGLIGRYLKLSRELSVILSFSVLTLDYFDPVFKDYVLDDADFENMTKFMAENREIHIQDSMLGSADILAKRCCGVGKTLVSIGAEGEIYPCYMLHRDELIMGNIFTDDLKEVMKSTKNLCRDITVDDFFECSDCDYKYICGGGCRASSYYMHKDFLHPETSCKKSKQYLKNVVDNMKSILNIN